MHSVTASDFLSLVVPKKGDIQAEANDASVLFAFEGVLGQEIEGEYSDAPLLADAVEQYADPERLDRLPFGAFQSVDAANFALLAETAPISTPSALVPDSLPDAIRPVTNDDAIFNQFEHTIAKTVEALAKPNIIDDVPKVNAQVKAGMVPAERQLSGQIQIALPLANASEKSQIPPEPELMERGEARSGARDNSLYLVQPQGAATADLQPKTSENSSQHMGRETVSVSGAFPQSRNVKSPMTETEVTQNLQTHSVVSQTNAAMAKGLENITPQIKATASEEIPQNIEAPRNAATMDPGRPASAGENSVVVPAVNSVSAATVNSIGTADVNALPLFSLTEGDLQRSSIVIDSARTATQPTLAANYPVAQSVAQQISVAVKDAGEGSVEIALSPEELGRVRLNLSPQDGTLVVTVSAERPETLDLMRRQIDSLAQELRELGYQEMSFEFGEGDESAQGEEHQHQTKGGAQDQLGVDDVSNTNSTRMSRSDAGLDIRL